MDTKKLNAIESMGWKYMLECCLDSGPKGNALKKKRFKNGCWKVGHTLMEISARYLIPSKSREVNALADFLPLKPIQSPRSEKH